MIAEVRLEIIADDFVMCRKARGDETLHLYALTGSLNHIVLGHNSDCVAVADAEIRTQLLRGIQRSESIGVS